MTDAPTNTPTRVELVRAHRWQFKSGIKEAMNAVDGGWRPEPTNTPTLSALKDAIQYAVERIVLRRIHEGRIDGYTLATGKEIAEAVIALPQIARPMEALREAERDRLAEERDNWKFSAERWQSAFSKAFDRAEAAEKERDRLAAALREIAVPGNGSHWGRVARACLEDIEP